MSPTFNLVDQPWLLAQRLDGTPDEVSLLEVFRQARSLRSLAGDVPTQVLANMRLLLAVLYAATEVTGREHWEQLWHDGPPLTQLDQHLTDHRHRFQLFDAVAPFYQVADLRTASGKVDGLQKIIADVPNGAPFLTTRREGGLRRIHFAEAARWLVHVHAYDPSGIRSGAVGDPDQQGGKGYPIGPAWVGRLGGILLLGDDLWQTLMLNLVPLDKFPVGSGQEDDLAPWERPPDSALRTDLSGPGPRGPVHLLTLQSRRVRLVADHTGVTGVVLAQGDRLLPQNRFAYEPMTAWRYSKPQTVKAGQLVYMPREHSPDRALWRNTAALLPAVLPGDPAPTLPPRTVEWAAEVSGVIGGHRRLGLQALGMTYGAQEAVVSEIVNDTVDLSVSLLGRASERMAVLIDDAVHSAETAVREAGRLAANLARAAGERGEDAGGGAYSRAAADGFARLDQPCRVWLSSLEQDSDREEVLVQWEREVRRMLLELGSELVAESGPGAVVGRVVDGTFMNAATAELWFRRKLAALLPRAVPVPPSPQGAS